MYCSRALRALPLLLLGVLLLLGGCAKNEKPRPVRLAVLRFENLSQDASADWIGRALSDVLAKNLHALANGAGRLSSAPGISIERQGAIAVGATHTLTGYYTVHNGKIDVTAIEEDLATQKAAHIAHAEGTVISVAESIGRNLGARASEFETRSEPALHAFAKAQEDAPAQAASEYEQAVRADPKFGEAYVAWCRLALQTNDREGVERVLQLASTDGREMPQLDRAYLDYEIATAKRDAPARLAALETVVKLSPSNAGVLRTLAEVEMASRHFPEAVKHLEQAAALGPNDADVRNLLAYAQMYAGDFAGAISTVRVYQQLKPDDPNTIDTEGDINYAFGKFAEAEKKYLEAYAKDENFEQGADQWKAARARWTAGDHAGADKLFATYLEGRIRAKDPMVPFRAARWKYFSGARDEAIREIAAAGDRARDPDVRSLCYTQTGIWEIIAGRRENARKYGMLALKPERPATALNAVLVNFLSQPPASADEWRMRAEQGIHGAGVENFRRLAVAYALTVDRHYADAAPLWKQIYEASTPNEEAPKRIYALVLEKTGRAEEAAALLKVRLPPQPANVPSWEGLY